MEWAGEMTASDWSNPSTTSGTPWQFTQISGDTYWTIIQVPQDGDKGTNSFRYEFWMENSNWTATDKFTLNNRSDVLGQGSSNAQWINYNGNNTNCNWIQFTDAGYYFVRGYNYWTGAQNELQATIGPGRVLCDGNLYNASSDNAFKEWPTTSELGTDNGLTFYAYWDTQFLYLGLTGVDLASASNGDFFVAIDTGGPANGVYRSPTWDERYHHLPIAADACLTVDASTYKAVRRHDGSAWINPGDGQGFGSGGAEYVGPSNSEFKVRWTAINGSGIPSTLRMVAWYQPNDANNHGVSASWPPQNPAGSSDTEMFTHYYYWANPTGSIASTGYASAKADSRIITNRRVVINEVLAVDNARMSSVDSYCFVELYNPAPVAVDVSNWVITDQYTDWTIPASTTLSPQKFLVYHLKPGLNYTDSWGATHIFSSSNTTINPGTASAGNAVSLFTSSSKDSFSLTDFVLLSTNASPSTLHDSMAVWAGIWPENTGAPGSGSLTGNSVGRTKTDGTDSDNAGDWDAFGTAGGPVWSPGFTNGSASTRVTSAQIGAVDLAFKQSNYTSDWIATAVLGDTIYLACTVTNTPGNTFIEGLPVVVYSPDDTIVVTLRETTPSSKQFIGYFIVTNSRPKQNNALYVSGSSIIYCTSVVTGGNVPYPAVGAADSFYAGFDLTGPTISLKRDSHVMKSNGATYGYLFRATFSDASGLDSAWVTTENGLNTGTVRWPYAAFATETFRVQTDFTSALTNNAINRVYLWAQDIFGNKSSVPLYIQKETLTAADGDTSDWQDDEILDQRKGNFLRVAWDDTGLYLSYGGPDGAIYEVGGAGADFFLYMQTSRATTADSTYTPINWSGYGNVHKLPFGANYCVVLEGDYTTNEEDNLITEFQSVTAGAWSGNLQVDSTAYLGRHSSNNRTNEYRISWSHLGGMPDSILLIFYHQYEGASNIYNALPPGNPAGGAATVVFTDYYNIPILRDTVSPATSLRLSTNPGTRRIDGDTAEWQATLWPTSDDTSILGSTSANPPEFVWRAKLDDRRNFFTDVYDNFDLRQFRITADTRNIYFLSVMKNITDPNLPMLAIAIDTNLIVNNGQQEIGGIARTRTVDTAKWEANFLVSTARTGWWNNDFSAFQSDGSSYINAGAVDAFELSMPWTRLYPSTATGDSLPRRLRFTVITGRKGTTDIYDFEKDGSWNATTTSRAMDGITLASRKDPDFGAEVSDPDTEVGYYFEVDFDTVGNIIPNRIQPQGDSGVYKADSVVVMKWRAVDWNGNAVSGIDGRIGATMVFSHTGNGTLVFTDSTSAWSSAEKNVSLRYNVAETITVTCTTLPYGRVATFRLAFLKDTSGANPWYVNDGSTTGDSFTGAAGSVNNNGLTRWTPKASLADILPFLTAGDTVYIDAGTYNPAGTLTIVAESVTLWGADSRTTIIDWNDSSGGSNFSLYATGRDSLTIRDLTLADARNGLFLENCDFAVVQRVRATTCGENGFLLQTDVDSASIQACYADTNASSGFYFGEADFCSITSSRSVGNTNVGFILAAGSDSNRLMHCVASGNADGFKVDNSMGNRLTGCTALSQTGAGFVTVVAGSTYNILEYTLAQSSGAQGYYFGATSYNRVESTIALSSTGKGYEFSFAVGFTIDNNQALSSGGIGFYLENSDTNTFRRNWSKSSGSDGIKLEASDFNTVLGCTTMANVGPGLVVTGASLRNTLTSCTSTSDPIGVYVDAYGNNEFRHLRVDTPTGVGFDLKSNIDTYLGCRVYGSTSHGFFLEDAASYNLLDSNFVIKAGGSGFYLSSGSVFNTLRGNSDSGSSGAGFLLDGADSNSFHANYSAWSGSDGFKMENGADSNSFRGDSSERSGSSGFATLTSSLFASFVGCTVVSPVGNAFYLNADSATVLACTAVSPGAAGFLLLSNKYSLLRDNLSVSAAGIGFFANGADSNTLDRNTTRGGSSDAFKVDNADFNTLTSNRADTAGGAGFAFLGASHGNLAVGNTAAFTINSGFYIDADSNVFFSNLAKNSIASGFSVLGKNAIVLVGNQSDSNDDYQFYIETGSDGLTLTRNNLSPKPSTGTNGVYTDQASLSLTRNWWGTRDSVTIDAMISGGGKATSLFSPYRLGAVDTAAGADTVAPLAPDTVAAATTGMETILVSWSAVTADESEDAHATGLTGYSIWRAFAADSRLWELRGTVGSGATTYSDSRLAVNTRYFYRVAAYDEKSPWLNGSFYSDSVVSDTTWDRPTVVINELARGWTSSDKDSDFIEFYVKQDNARGDSVDLLGWKLYTMIGNGARTLRKTFGNVTVRSGTFITLFLATPAALADETTDDGDGRVNIYSTASNDLLEGGATNGDVLVELEAADGTVVDVLAYSDGAWAAGQTTRLGDLQALGQWSPDGDAANTVSNTSLGIKGISLQRDSIATDNNTKDDWLLDSQTAGNFPIARYEMKSDSLTPYLGLPFNLTIWAVDGRGETVVNHRTTPRLSLTNGAISPTSAGFGGEGDYVHGSTGETVISVTLSGYSGTITCSAVFSDRTGSIVLEARAGLESFTLVPLAPIKRGAPFPLRIKANTVLGSTATWFTGPLPLSVDSYSVSPTSVIFTATDLGDTIIMATLDGVGVITLTADTSGKSGSCTAVPVPDTRIVINEFYVNDQNRQSSTRDRDEWIELYNRGLGSVSLSGWTFRIRTYDQASALTYTFPAAATIPAQGFAVIHFNKTGADDFNATDTDGCLNLYATNSSPPMADSEDILPGSSTHDSGAIGLYISATQDSTTIVDFVGYSGNGSADANLPDTTHAVQAGIWRRAQTLSLPTSSSLGRAFYLAVDGWDSDLGSTWSLLSSADSYSYTEGRPNINSQPTSVTSIAVTSSSSTTGETCAAGDTLFITLTASAGGNASAVDATNVYVRSTTDMTGIVVTLRETANNSLIFQGEAYIATSPLESNDGMRIIHSVPDDSVYVQWTYDNTVQDIQSSVGTPYRLVCTAPLAVIVGEPMEIHVAAVDAAGFKVATYTGTINVTVTDSISYPASFPIIAADNGETLTFVTLGAGVGSITCTVTASGILPGTAAITVLPTSSYLINEVLANVGTIDWNPNDAQEEGRDEWVEIYNSSDTEENLAGLKLGHSSATNKITLAGTLPARGWVTIYQGVATAASSYHFDSTGAHVATNLALTGSWPEDLPNAGGTVQLWSAGDTLIAMLAYPSATNDVSYGRAPDGRSAVTLTSFTKPSPGIAPAAGTDAETSANARFVVDAPDTARLDEAFTLNVALLDKNGDTVTSFNGLNAYVAARANGTLSVSTLSFTNGVAAANVSYTAGDIDESSGIYVYYAHGQGVHAGYDSLTLLAGSDASLETSIVSVTQAVADGIDTALVQIVVLSANGSPVAGATVTCTTAKQGPDTVGRDTVSAVSQLTNSFGVCTFTIVSRDTNPSKVYVTVNTLTLRDSPLIYWLDPTESGVYTSFGTLIQLGSTLNDTGQFYLWPNWRADGLALAYVAKVAADIDTWAVYVAWDDGQHGDNAAADGQVVTYRVTGVQHNVAQNSRPSWGDILDTDGARVASYTPGDGRMDIVYTAYNGTNRKDIYVVRASGADSTVPKASTVRLTDGSGNWSQPIVAPGGDTLYAVQQGGIYRLDPKGTFLWSLGGVQQMMFLDISVNGMPHAAVDIALYGRDVMAVSVINNKPAYFGRNIQGEILILNCVDTFQGMYATVDGNRVKQVRRNDSSVCWNLSWDTGGRALSFTRDVNGKFNYIALNARHADPRQAYGGVDFDVEAVYITDTGYAPYRPAPLINNAGGINDNGAGFSPGNAARVAYVSHDTIFSTVKLNILNIDGVAQVNTSGGLLFEGGRVTAIVDEGDVLSGSVKIQVGRPAGVPGNSTPESIALTGNAREFFPKGQTFADSITVILYYDADDLTTAGITNGTAGEYSLKVFWYNPTADAWEDYNAVVDPTDRNGALGSLTFRTNHFSIYGVGVGATLPHEAAPLSPPQGHVTASRRPTFAWTHNDPASRPQVGWHIQAALDTNFNAPLYDRNGSGPDSTHTAGSDLLSSGDSTIHWRVRTAAVANAWGQWSRVDSWFRIIHRLPSAPVIAAPAEGLETRSFPALAWTHVDADSQAQTHVQVEISSAKDFSAIAFGEARETTVTTMATGASLASGTWYWRLRTASASGFGAWSESRTLIINRAPLAPTVTASPDTLRHPYPSFAWTHNSPELMPQASATLDLAADPSFTSLYKTLTFESAAGSLTLLEDNALAVRGAARVYWRLRTATSEGLLGAPATGSFWLALSPPSAPVLLAPAHQADTTATTLTFAWQHVDVDGDPQANYHLRLARDTTFAAPVFSELVNGAAASRSLAGLAGTYYWQVATGDTYDLGAWSAARVLSVSAASVAPLPLGPTSASLVTTPQPTVSWQHRHSSGSPQVSALLEFATNPGFAPLWRSVAVSGASQSHELAGADSLAFIGETTVYWRIRTAVLGTDYGPVSAESTFTLRIAPPSAPSPTAPADSTATRNREVEFRWLHRSTNDSLPQIAYELRLGRETEPAAASDVRTISDVSNGGVVAWMDGGRWYWQVRTMSAAGWSPWSGAQTVTVDTHALTPALLSPTTGATITTPRPTFRWRHTDPEGFSQQGARIEIGTETAFVSPVAVKVVTGSADSWTPSVAESIPLTGDRTLFWRVQTASFGTDFGPAESESSFQARFNAPTVPTLVPPADTSRQRLPVLGVLHADGEGNAQEGVRVQVSQSPDFATTVLDLVAETTASSFTPSAPLAGGRHWWRAATRDAVGWSPWAAADDFWVDTRAEWRTLRLSSARVVPAGETRLLALELVSETGALIAWTGQASVRIGSRVLAGNAFATTATGAEIPLRIDTAGRYLVMVSEVDAAAGDTLHVLAKPASITGETWVLVSGRAGVGQRVDARDTVLTVIVSNPSAADTALRLRITTGRDTVLTTDLAPASLDSGLVYFLPSSLSLPAGERLTIVASRGGDTIATVEALVFTPAGTAFSASETSAGRGISVDVPAGACDTPFFITFRVVPRDSWLNATRGPGRQVVETSIIEIVSEDMDGNPIETFRQNLTLRFPLGGGRNPRIAFLRNGAWVELGATSFSELSGEASGQTDHLSVWGLVVGGPGNINAVVTYPNPWRSDQGVTNANSDAYGIKFDQLPTGPVHFRIFTVAGELVVDGTLDPATLGATAAGNALKVIDVGGLTGQVTRWNLRNQHNQHVASGLYLIRMDHSSGSIVKRVAVIR